VWPVVVTGLSKKLGKHDVLVSAQRSPLAFVVFSLIGTTLLLIAIVLAVLGSFAFIAIAAVGCFFIAAALVARAARSSAQRAAAVISVAGLALVIFGMVATPLFYLGWACLGAGLIALAAATVALRPGESARK
jgi:hypothetical protein